MRSLIMPVNFNFRADNSNVPRTWNYNTVVPQTQIQNKPFFTQSTLTSANPRLYATSGLSLSGIWKSIVDFFKSCLSCFGLFSRPTQSAAPVVSVDRENRLISRPDEIHRRLNLQMRRAKEQMDHEPVKNFRYTPAPAGMEAHEERVGNLPVGICHAQGRRPTMEDEHIATSFNLRIGDRNYPVQLFGIFDGHGGNAASRYVRDHLKEKLEQALQQYNPSGLSEAGIWRALKVAFVRLNQDFRRTGILDEGTTATMAMILDGNLWTANVGDSRTVLDNGGEFVRLTEDGKPSEQRYKKGIENRGGRVIDVAGVPRVNGLLAVARAIGDHGLNGAISARPKITVMPLSEIRRESHLILCCDGIYDVARTRDIVASAHVHRNESAAALAKNIVNSAYIAGSGDNLSCLVVKLDAAHFRTMLP